MQWGIRFGHFGASEGIRFQKRGKTWESWGIRFCKMGIRFSKTPFLEGIKRNQLPPLKF